MKTRDTYFDFLRGVAIIFVVGIHTYSDNSTHTHLFLRQFLNCAVPIFLAISGYFIGSKSLNNKVAYFSFLRRQIPRVYIPMLIWSIPWLIFVVNEGANLLFGLVRASVGELSIFYFIPLIIQFYILTPIIQSVNKSYGGGYAIAITVIGVSLFDYFTKIKGLPVNLLFSAGPFPVWMIFFVMGVLVSQGIRIPFQLNRPVKGIVIGFLLSCIQALAIYCWCGNWAPGIKLASHIYTYFVIMWMFSNQARLLYHKINHWNIINAIVDLGRLSFFVYLTHCLLIVFISRISFMNNWFVAWISCVILSYLLAFAGDRVLPFKIKRYFGF